MMNLKVGIVGANGYGGAELLRLLKNHPYVQIKDIISHQTKGNRINQLYPHFDHIYDMVLEELREEEITSSIDCLLFATPSGVSKDLVPQFVRNGIKCIDLSGDFRLKSASDYEYWYKKSPAPDEFIQQAVYGLSEWSREAIREASIIANPGCFPTAALLGLLPVLKHRLIDPKTIIIDAKTGVSGAGRSATISHIYSEVNENVKPYKVGNHQHIPEIEQMIHDVTGLQEPITFTTHLLPMTRGIMCTIYAQVEGALTTSDFIDLYRSVYQNEKFIRIKEPGQFPATKEVQGSNFCDIGMMRDKRTNRITIVSVIDNLVKGAAGQAIQNLNLINGWDETVGLDISPLYP